MSNIHIIRSRRDAEEALSVLAERKFLSELDLIRQTARNMSQARAGVPGRERALRAVLIGFSDNIEELAS